MQNHTLLLVLLTNDFPLLNLGKSRFYNLTPSKLVFQFCMNRRELVLRNVLLRPPDDEAFVIRFGRLGNNVEMDMVHKLFLFNQLLRKLGVLMTIYRT
jgi:hypothetical protein